MALLPAGFRFSQASLVASERCRRRFYLRYLRQLAWPAPSGPAGEGVDQAAERGRFFHHLVHQDALGLEVAPLVAASGDLELMAWWENYRRSPPAGLPQGVVFSELELWVPLGPWWLAARFDRVVVGTDGRVCIADWKTGRQPPAAYLDSWQTLVYCYVMCEGGGLLRGGEVVEPGQLSFCYWSAQFPEQVQWHHYSAALHQQARLRLEQVTGALAALERREDFAKTEDESSCQGCEFRAFCARKGVPGKGWDLGEEEEDWEELDPFAPQDA